MNPYASPFTPPVDVAPATAMPPTQRSAEIIGSAPGAASTPRRRPPGSAVAAVAAVALVTAGLTYALVTTRQDLARTTRTLSVTRTDLTNAQDELSATRATLSGTEKTLSDTQAELTAARDQISSIKSQLADARDHAQQEKTRGDEAVEAAADLRLCLNNVLVNANAMQNGDYAGMTWSDAMYTQCRDAIAEADAMADAPPTTTTV